MAWQQLSLHSDADRAARIGHALEAAGALSVTLLDAGDDPVLEPAPGETPLWAALRIVALFSEATDLAPLQAALSPHLNAAERDSWRVEPLADQAWARTWLAHFHPLRMGQRLWVCPTGQEPPVDDAVVLRLDPGLAFGTGTHPTTALCLRWLDAHPPAGSTVIDYGCGSGILAIAAALLGATAVRATDIDPQALAATRENAMRNGVAPRIDATLPATLGHEPADLVLANILAGPLVELAPTLCGLLKPGADLVLAGLLAAQADEVRAAYGAAVEWLSAISDEEWVCLHGRRR